MTTGAAVDPKRLLEALLFATAEPLPERELAARLNGLDPPAPPLADLLADLARDYEGRGVRLERHGDAYAFRTAPDLGPHLARVRTRERRLPRVALETLAVIAYRQPVTRAEIEAIRGVAVAKGTLDLLLERGWVAPKGRRDAPGRPVTWVTTAGFLDEFGLASLDDLPRPDELEGASLFGAAVEAPTPPDG
jgi:segregation and condensation protein B